MRSKCCNSQAPGEVCAELLSALDYKEITEIMDKKDFNLEILKHGLCHQRGSSNQKEQSSSALFLASRDSLSSHIRALTEALPRPAAVFNPGFWSPSQQEARYAHRLKASFQSGEFRDALVLLMEPYACLLEDASHCAQDLCEKDESMLTRPALGLFGLLSLEFVKWAGSSTGDASLTEREALIRAALRSSAAAFRCQAISAGWFALEENWPAAVSAVLCVHALFRELLHIKSSRLAASDCFSEMLKDKNSDPDCEVRSSAVFSPPPPHSAVIACMKLAEMFECVVSHPSSFASTAKDLSGPLEDVILGLCRLPVFSTYVRVPPEVWKLNCWDVQPSGNLKTTFPIPPVELLQDGDVLREYLRRASVLGWLNRQQFEELWVSLLGVFGVSSSEEARGEEEAKALAQCSALIVHGLTNVIMQTTYLPIPGQANLSRPIHHSRDHPSQFLLSPRGQQLTAIQNYIQFAQETEGSSHHYLKVLALMTQ